MMAVIDYNKFLATRFDLVIRWYLLEKVDFDAQEAKILAKSEKCKKLQSVFAILLKKDMAEVPYVGRKVKRAGVSKGNYGSHTAQQLFSMPNWCWIEKHMLEGDNWIRNNPYPIRVNGLGLAVKRFILALKHERCLYWVFQKKGKALLSLWNQSKYRVLLGSREYGEIEEARCRMMVRMKELEFFSADMYIGETELFERWYE